jgi:hypothetical protein
VFKPPCLKCSNRSVQGVQTVLFKVFKPLGAECSNCLVWSFDPKEQSYFEFWLCEDFSEIRTSRLWSFGAVFWSILSWNTIDWPLKLRERNLPKIFSRFWSSEWNNNFHGCASNLMQFILLGPKVIPIEGGQCEIKEGNHDRRKAIWMEWE